MSNMWMNQTFQRYKYFESDQFSLPIELESHLCRGYWIFLKQAFFVTSMFIDVEIDGLLILLAI